MISYCPYTVGEAAEKPNLTQQKLVPNYQSHSIHLGGKLSNAILLRAWVSHEVEFREVRVVLRQLRQPLGPETGKIIYYVIFDFFSYGKDLLSHS